MILILRYINETDLTLRVHTAAYGRARAERASQFSGSSSFSMSADLSPADCQSSG